MVGTSVADPVLTAARAILTRLLSRASANAPKIATVGDTVLDGPNGPIATRLYTPFDCLTDPPLVYLHGGGFVCCSIETHDALCRWLSTSARIRIVSVGYGLAPENKFPAQLNDALAACRHVLAESSKAHGRGQILVGGDSAGAYLAALCALRLNAEKPGSVPLQLLLYPLIHLQDDIWSSEILRSLRLVGRIAVAYIRAQTGSVLYPSLLNQDLRASPSTILAVGELLDPVRADVEAYASSLTKAKIPIVDRRYGGLLHGELNLTDVSSRAVNALRDIGQVLRRELDRASLV